MTTFAALLRGINVGGHRKIRMSDLKQVHQSLGHENPVTVLQSGNVVFDCAESDGRALARNLENAYEQAFGFPVGVIVRGTASLRDIAANNPFPLTADREAKFLHVFLLSDAPEDKVLENFRAVDRIEDVEAVGDTVYIYYPQGAGRSKLTLGSLEKALNVTATARNWNTITKLVELASQR